LLDAGGNTWLVDAGGVGGIAGGIPSFVNAGGIPSFVDAGGIPWLVDASGIPSFVDTSLLHPTKLAANNSATKCHKVPRCVLALKPTPITLFSEFGLNWYIVAALPAANQK
jgi:hypothetical protein